MQTITSTAAWMKLLMLKPATLEASATIGTARDESLLSFLNVQKEGLLFMFNMGVSQNETHETHGKPTVFFFFGGGVLILRDTPTTPICRVVSSRFFPK